MPLGVFSKSQQLGVFKDSSLEQGTVSSPALGVFRNSTEMTPTSNPLVEAGKNAWEMAKGYDKERGKDFALNLSGIQKQLFNAMGTKIDPTRASWGDEEVVSPEEKLAMNRQALTMGMMAGTMKAGVPYGLDHGHVDTMERFIDYARLSKSPNLELEEDAARLAEDLGIKGGKTAKSLANAFDRVLQKWSAHERSILKK